MKERTVIIEVLLRTPALVNEPKILLVDEIPSGPDSKVWRLSWTELETGSLEETRTVT